MNSANTNNRRNILGARQAMTDDLASGKTRPIATVEELMVRYSGSDRHSTRIEFRDALERYSNTTRTILVLTSPDLETVLGVTDDCGGAFEDPAIQAKLSRMTTGIDEPTMRRLARSAATIRSQASRDVAIGFSSSTSLPASSAAQATSACR